VTGEPQKLREGRERYQKSAKRQRRRDAFKRVQVYERWVKGRRPMREIPPIPSSADYRIVNGNRR
jgi:hypothetical protein